ncbi:Formylglycine-generating enzyme, required for sulfatase activity, contains SUMF1/FGE domain [Flaviramulus basaltis]|uniref:Formylglycine-generating enzyme, required for sulfatase activity, contains SUMF1/FGE domain n=1 Tax=Flaviramulus basaltis TaxID=369401 RepID=A0A1K2IMT2_9FLAO|nr:formylglycine-generating enzyme family protein [Flaviramulus basaltis]SFZ93562.1 Formylglycine-generating enzyme, required for sulfatase activity, contains SUMF1/FGE domain [Flaviramulus basaltis]
MFVKVKTIFPLFLYLFLTLLLFNCKKNNKESHNILSEKRQNRIAPEGMIWVNTKTFIQGAKGGDEYAMSREKPAHQVTVDGFFMDMTEVTNKQFKAFVDTTKYVTVAERKIDWEGMKKQLPEGTPKPHDSILQPGSLIFNKNLNKVATMGNYSQWWIWKIGANWKHPEGPESSIEGKDNFPVVHIAYEDALAYCKWDNRRLPTESEWEAAAQGTGTDQIYTWGNSPDVLNQNANTWQGVFPIKNKSEDGFEFIAPVKSYPPNSIGLYDMMGNVWEITSDLFNVNYYKELDTLKTITNPKGAEKGYSPDNPNQQEHVIKGGSFLCHASYCASFRISAKMGISPDSGSDHTGFRTVATPSMIGN